MRGERWTPEEARKRLQQWLAMGWTLVGIDEAGRGPLAGPVVAAALLLTAQGARGTGQGARLHELLFAEPPLFRDSKQLSSERREQLFRLLCQSGALFAVGKASPAEIDRLNIRQATLLAMRRALTNLTSRQSPIASRLDLVLVDGNHLGDLGVPTLFIVDGDEICPLISAASIIAKVVRDRLMVAYDRRYPQYGFAQHKGYPTRQHLAALRQFGPCPIHRKSFAPVGNLLER
jgi:ribonuclease HII